MRDMGSTNEENETLIECLIRALDTTLREYGVSV